MGAFARGSEGACLAAFLNFGSGSGEALIHSPTGGLMPVALLAAAGVGSNRQPFDAEMDDLAVR